MVYFTYILFSGGFGLRHARNINLAFTSKLGWGLIHKRDELWVQVIPSRYNREMDLIPIVQSTRNCSNTWKGICVAWHEVESNLGWRIGNGSVAHFWTDKWMSHGQKLQDVAMIDIPHHLLE